MANSIMGPRKKRTRQHVIADLSVHYVEGFILEEGHTSRRLDSEFSYDLVMRTFDDTGYVEPGAVYFQVKASEVFLAFKGAFVYDVDVRDYNLWMREEMPVILVLFDASQRMASWLCVQRYFDEDDARKPRKGAKTVRVRIPTNQSLSRRAIQMMRELRNRWRDWEPRGQT